MLLEKIKYNLQNNGDSICAKNEDEKYTYSKMYSNVRKIYKYLLDNNIQDKVVCYGKKSPKMVATFLACSFAGLTYVPIDINIPQNRVEYILENVKSNLIFNYSNNELNKKYKEITIDSENLNNILNEKEDIDLEIKLMKEDIYYILYTSGSTGNPKGVQVSYSNLECFIDWYTNDIGAEKINVLNQVSFSFDLSQADIYFSLYTGSTLNILNKSSILELDKIYNFMKDSNMNFMLTTPSFAEVLLSDKKFSEELIPSIKKIYFCGEILQLKTIQKLKTRFPNIIIKNTYGPTECTIAITSIEVQNIEEDNVPIGYVMPGVKVYIVDENLQKIDNENIGEILITGNCVAKGYVGISSKNFISYNGVNGYLTGDLGFIKDNKLYYVGRKDSQIKYKGYRIELNDITSNIYLLDYVKKAITIANKNNEGIVAGIISFVMTNNNCTEDIQKIKLDLKKVLPKYMIPKIKLVDEFILNQNGKVDIKKMEEKYCGRKNNANSI